MGSIRRRGVPIVAVVAGAMLLPAAAFGAAEKPVATTGGAANITSTTALLNGSVDPKGAATTYLFQFGTTRLYESRTGSLDAGSGSKGKKIAIAVVGLVPNTTYHYRLVAQNRKGLTFGKDRTLKTKKEPLALTLAATPNPVRAGRATNLSGVLSGTGHANRQIKLESSAWPFTTWVQDGNPQVTGATGAFSFPILSVPREHAVPRVPGLEPDHGQPGARRRHDGQGHAPREGLPRHEARQDPLLGPPDARH